MTRRALTGLAIFCALLLAACRKDANSGARPHPTIQTEPTAPVQATPLTSAGDELRRGASVAATPMHDPMTVVVSSEPPARSNPPESAASSVTTPAITGTPGSGQTGVSAASLVDADHDWIAVFSGDLAMPVILATTDGGQHWAKLSGLGGQISRLDFVSLEVGWAVTDSGLFKTLDGGSTWRMESASGISNIADLDFIDLREGWMSDGDGLLHTADGGDTWGAVVDPCSVGGRTPWPDPFSFISHETGWIMCGGEPGAGFELKSLFHTDDGGRSWQEISQTAPVGAGDGSGAPTGLPRDAYVSDISFVDAQHGWLAEDRGSLLQTADGGHTWAPVSGLVSLLTGEDFEHSVQFVSPALGFLVGSPRGLPVLRETQDGGTTWSQLYPPR